MNSAISLILGNSTNLNNNNHNNNIKDQLGEQVKNRFEEFLQEFTLLDSNNIKYHPYINFIKQLSENDKTTLYVSFQHIISFDKDLAEIIELQYYRLDIYLRKAVQNVAKKILTNLEIDSNGNKIFQEYWVSFFSGNDFLKFCKLRELRSSQIGTLCMVMGTITRTSEVRPELIIGSFTCMDCRISNQYVPQQFKYTEPLVCSNPTCQNTSRWQLIVEQSIFVDWQKIRLQENTNEIPSGSMPRSIDVILRHEEVEKAKAGDKCIFTGTLIVIPDISRKIIGTKSKLNRNSQIKGKNKELYNIHTSLYDYSYKLAFLACHVQPADIKLWNPWLKDQYTINNLDIDDIEQFTEQEMKEIEKMKRDPNIYKKLINSIAPAVFGHKEVKKGILLMLFGGVHKTTIEGINLRGDINVCVVGDPSTSKSQFLKYVVSFLPRAIYTSGKASSAAGLTATVIRDPDTGEFNIEAGALMLADNGICCIDEFDKMDLKDQVAIHEAMEQQTISIAKAGIHATLNARTSILAAANPVGGRYDKSKTLKNNLNIGPAIMSRFDLFFVILDECDEITDYNIAKHIVEIHQNKDSALNPEFTTKQLKSYIKYARTLKPIITKESKKILVDNYRKLRQNEIIGHNKASYRITVRQLESMIRLSEALARLHCDEKIHPEYVLEAVQLLRKSIIHVETGDVIFEIPKLLNSSNPNNNNNQENSFEEYSEVIKKKKSPIQIPFEKYKQISDIIILYLHKFEEGKKQKEIIEWYLEQMKNELDSEEKIKLERTIIKNIINRLINKDRILIIIEESNTKDINQRIIAVNPNHEIFNQ